MLRLRLPPVPHLHLPSIGGSQESAAAGNLGYGGLGVVDEQRRDAEPGRRRGVNVAAEVVEPVRRVRQQTYLVGHGPCRGVVAWRAQQFDDDRVSVVGSVEQGQRGVRCVGLEAEGTPARHERCRTHVAGVAFRAVLEPDHLRGNTTQRERHPVACGRGQRAARRGLGEQHGSGMIVGIASRRSKADGGGDGQDPETGDGDEE